MELLLKKVERAATMWVPGVRDLSFAERLKKLHPLTLADRSERGGIIMTYKCVEGIEKIDEMEYIIPSRSSFRGHSNKLYKKRLKKTVKITVSWIER